MMSVDQASGIAQPVARLNVIDETNPGGWFILLTQNNANPIPHDSGVNVVRQRRDGKLTETGA